VAAGFEHSVANMYFIPEALLIKAEAPESFWVGVRQVAADYPNLTWGHFLFNNLLPVTIGNVIGGAVLVGAVYWFVYLRKRSVPSPAPADSLLADEKAIRTASAAANGES
jgi:formate transporter